MNTWCSMMRCLAKDRYPQWSKHSSLLIWSMKKKRMGKKGPQSGLMLTIRRGSLRARSTIRASSVRKTCRSPLKKSRSITWCVATSAWGNTKRSKRRANYTWFRSTRTASTSTACFSNEVLSGRRRQESSWDSLSKVWETCTVWKLCCATWGWAMYCCTFQMTLNSTVYRSKWSFSSWST